MNKKRFFGGLLIVYGISTLTFYSIFSSGGLAAVSGAGEGSGDSGSGSGGFQFGAEDLGALCISAIYPGAVAGLADSRDNEDSGASALSGGKDGQGKIQTVESEEPEPEPVVFGDDPAVLIVHTHATETYMPASSGNYHSKKEENSVREVGELLAKSLEEEGISAVHDKTLHDSPSYSNSYSRSYTTIQELLEEYPTVECVIDLHRDAIASEATAPTISVNGKVCAKYLYVVSTAVPTYESNKKFIKALNKIAGEEFSGYTGSSIERGYAYNQSLSDKYLLLEIGNNRNDIQDAKNTASIYGKILAETMKRGY